MIHNVKILRPDKDGKLIEIEQIPSLEVSKIYWSNFNKDKHRSTTAANTGVKYHRIGVDLKQCIEKNCKVIITDPRRKTCSPECKNKRVERQRQLSKEKRIFRKILIKEKKLIRVGERSPCQIHLKDILHRVMTNGLWKNDCK